MKGEGRVEDFFLGWKRYWYVYRRRRKKLYGGGGEFIGEKRND